MKELILIYSKYLPKSWFYALAVATTKPTPDTWKQSLGLCIITYCSLQQTGRDTTVSNIGQGYMRLWVFDNRLYSISFHLSLLCMSCVVSSP